MLENLDHIEMVSATDARESLSDYVERAAKEGVRFGIKRHKTPVGAIVPITDLEYLEALDRKALEAQDAADERALDAHAIVEVAQIAIADGGGKQFATYLAGQMAARLVDEGVVRDRTMLNSILEIAKRTISSALNNEEMPNPPSEYVHYGLVDRDCFAKAALIEEHGEAMYYEAHARVKLGTFYEMVAETADKTTASLEMDAAAEEPSLRSAVA